MSNPKKTTKRERAVALLAHGRVVSVRQAAREVGLSDATVRRELAELGKRSTAELEAAGLTAAEVEGGLQVIRSALLARMAERLASGLDDAKPSELRDLAVAFGILDDKLNGRGNSGNVSVTSATQVVIKTEWPEP